MSDRTNPPGSETPKAVQPPSVPATPAISKVPSGVHAMRRGGARREVTERVNLKTEDGKLFEGWALNVSRGGLRAILEDKVHLGQKFEIELGTDEMLRRSGRIVWVQEEPDGVIVGIEFTGMSGTQQSVPPPPPGAESERNLVAAADPSEPLDLGEKK
ncbi:MAG: PilZ domain-containing protein [Labilithrix sp.]|nr:PilZ domain-containing protein [Labilithrix sp.]MCW5815649.1 PilZ domain-containing protein [Labilithrix sp.]